MNEDVERFHEWAIAIAEKGISPVIITIVHQGPLHSTEPVSIDLLDIHNPIKSVTIKPHDGFPNYMEFLRNKNVRTVQIKKVAIGCRDFAQRDQTFEFYKDKITSPLLFMPNEISANFALMKDHFYIGAQQRLLYRLGASKNVMLAFYPAKPIEL
jgi:hypothetical protein